MPTVSVSGNGLEVAQPPPAHVKKTLPPTLSGFPGEAEIRYFVKVTVKRSAFWKENARAYVPFNFLPVRKSMGKRETQTTCHVESQND